MIKMLNKYTYLFKSVELYNQFDEMYSNLFNELSTSQAMNLSKIKYEMFDNEDCYKMLDNEDCFISDDEELIETKEKIEEIMKSIRDFF